MQHEVIDENEAEEGVVLTTLAKQRWKQACSWMIASSVIGLSGCIIIFTFMVKFGAFKRMAFETFVIFIFLLVMSLKFIAQLYNGYQSKKYIHSDDKKGIEKSALTYSYIWMLMGILGLFFMICMILFLTAKTMVLGEISYILFKIPK